MTRSIEAKEALRSVVFGHQHSNDPTTAKIQRNIINFGRLVLMNIDMIELFCFFFSFALFDLFLYSAMKIFGSTASLFIAVADSKPIFHCSLLLLFLSIKLISICELWSSLLCDSIQLSKYMYKCKYMSKTRTCRFANAE